MPSSARYRSPATKRADRMRASEYNPNVSSKSVLLTSGYSRRTTNSYDYSPGASRPTKRTSSPYNTGAGYFGTQLYRPYTYSFSSSFDQYRKSGSGLNIQPMSSGYSRRASNLNMTGYFPRTSSLNVVPLSTYSQSPSISSLLHPKEYTSSISRLNIMPSSGYNPFARITNVLPSTGYTPIATTLGTHAPSNFSNAGRLDSLMSEGYNPLRAMPTSGRDPYANRPDLPTPAGGDLSLKTSKHEVRVVKQDLHLSSQPTPSESKQNLHPVSLHSVCGTPQGTCPSDICQLGPKSVVQQLSGNEVNAAIEAAFTPSRFAHAITGSRLNVLLSAGYNPFFYWLNKTREESK